MSAASCRLTEDQFLCPICLDVFTDPVSTPCGHTYCQSCITKHWKEKTLCSCPVCKQTFYSRPELQVNIFISEMVAQFRDSAQQETSSSSSSSSEQQAAKPGDVGCDICAGTKLKALKSCLLCLVSYCQTHLEPHRAVPGLKTHPLIDPVKNLENRICQTHFKPLEMFCKADQMFVCLICLVSHHQGHDAVPLNVFFEQMKAELDEKDKEIEKMIQSRQRKIQEFKDSVVLSNTNAEKEIEGGLQVFAALRQHVDSCLNQFIETVEEEKKRTEEEARKLITELEQEISELMKRSAEMKKLSCEEQDVELLQSVLHPAEHQQAKDWAEVRVYPALAGRSLRMAVERFHEEMLDSFSDEAKEAIVEQRQAELMMLQQYAVDVTLDPDSAHPQLLLSEDGKQVKFSREPRRLPESVCRFSHCFNVLGKDGFSSGRFYYEVQVKDKTGWDVGVACQSVSRDGEQQLGPQDGCWLLRLRADKYVALHHPLIHLSAAKCEKVGVFVDHQEGLVSFYDADEAIHLHSFTGCCFTQTLYALLNPHRDEGWRNSAPLILPD